MFGIAFLKMALQTAELAYINGRCEEAGNKLLWLERVISAYDDNLAAAPEVTERQTIRRRIEALLVQLGQGLDFYGFEPNYVPLTSLSIYQTFVGDMLVIGQHLEKAQRQFWQAGQDEILQHQAVEATTIACLDAIRVSKAQGEQLNTELRNVRTTILELLGEVLSLESDLQRSEQAFRDAVEREAQCGIDDVLRVAGAVVSLASGVGSILNGVTDMAKFNQQAEGKRFREKLQERGEYLAKHIKVVSGGVNNIREGYLSIRTSLGDGRDAAKLLVDKEEFERTLEPFKNLPQARDFKQLMSRFLSAVGTRNEHILQADTILTRIIQLDNEIERLTTEADKARDRLQEHWNPHDIANETFFETAGHLCTSAILRALVMGFRALRYWSVSEITPPLLQDRSVRHLEETFGRLKVDHHRAVVRRNEQPEEHWTPAEVLFVGSMESELFPAVSTVGSLSFALPTTQEEFGARMCMVLVKTARLRIGGLSFAPGARFVQVQLTHHGDAKVVDQFSREHLFRHRPRTRNGFIQPGNDHCLIDLGGYDDKYAFLSPFATWTVTLISGVEPSDRHAINEVGLSFEFLAFSRYGVV